MGASRSAGARSSVSWPTRKREACLRLCVRWTWSLWRAPDHRDIRGLADYICPGAGTVDEGIAREAYIETIVELASEGLTDLTTFTPDQMQTSSSCTHHAIEALSAMTSVPRL